MTTQPANSADVPVDAFASAHAAPDVVLLDVRTPEEYNAGHLEGARLIDFRSPTFAASLDGLDRDATYAVYCRSGGRSRQALDVMARLGFTHAYHLQPGILGWMEAGKPVVTD